jgi:hypothetical protein
VCLKTGSTLKDVALQAQRAVCDAYEAGYTVLFVDASYMPKSEQALEHTPQHAVQRFKQGMVQEMPDHIVSLLAGDQGVILVGDVVEGFVPVLVPQRTTRDPIIVAPERTLDMLKRYITDLGSFAADSVKTIAKNCATLPLTLINKLTQPSVGNATAMHLIQQQPLASSLDVQPAPIVSFVEPVSPTRQAIITYGAKMLAALKARQHLDYTWAAGSATLHEMFGYYNEVLQLSKAHVKDFLIHQALRSIRKTDSLFIRTLQQS